MELGEAIKNRREQLGLSQLDVAFACGVDKSTVCMWEKGRIKHIKSDKVFDLAQVLQLNPRALLKEPPENGFTDQSYFLPDSETPRVKAELAITGESSISTEAHEAYKQFSVQELELINLYRKLHPIDRNRIMKMIAIMAEENLS